MATGARLATWAQQFDSALLSTLPRPDKSLPAPNSRTIRLLQWNVLADSMYDDGFLVHPALSEWPVSRDSLPTADGQVLAHLMNGAFTVVHAPSEHALQVFGLWTGCAFGGGFARDAGSKGQHGEIGTAQDEV